MFHRIHLLSILGLISQNRDRLRISRIWLEWLLIRHVPVSKRVWTEAIPIASDIKTSHLCCLSLALVFDTTSPSAGACAIGISSIGRPSEPRLASPRHGTLTPGRISVGRPHCLIPISVGAVTGRKYHYPWRSHCDTACHRLFLDGWTRLAPYLAVVDRGEIRQAVITEQNV